MLVAAKYLNPDVTTRLKSVKTTRARSRHLHECSAHTRTAIMYIIKVLCERTIGHSDDMLLTDKMRN